jgi:ATP/ADP translocase
MCCFGSNTCSLGSLYLKYSCFSHSFILFGFCIWFNCADSRQAANVYSNYMRDMCPVLVSYSYNNASDL